MYRPVMVIQFANKWMRFDSEAEKTLARLQKMCENGAGEIRVEGFMVREMTRKDLTPESEGVEVSVDVPFTGTEIRAGEVVPESAKDTSMSEGKKEDLVSSPAMGMESGNS